MPKHDDMANSANNLASYYRRQGRFKDAEQLHRSALKIREEALGSEHPDVASSLENLANLFGPERYAEMEKLYQRSLKIREKALGEQHPLVANSLRNLALLQENLGKRENAEQFHLRSVKIRETQLGSAHPSAAESLSSLGLFYTRAGRTADASRAFDQARRSIRRHVVSVLPALSEREQLAFLKTTDKDSVNEALSFALQQREQPNIAERSAEWVVNSKATIQESLAQRALDNRDRPAPSVGPLIEQLSVVRQQLATLSLAVPSATESANHRKQLEALSGQEQTLAKRVAQASGRPQRDDPYVTLVDLRRRLGKNEVLIDIVRIQAVDFGSRPAEQRAGAARYVAWLIPAATADKVPIVDLGDAAKIDEAVKTFRSAMSTTARTADRLFKTEGEIEAEKQILETLRPLAQLTLHPLLKQVGESKQLVLCPDSALWLVPWAALPLDDGQYAVEKYEIRYVVSSRELAAGPPPAVAPQRAAVFADPDYDFLRSTSAAQRSEVKSTKAVDPMRKRSLEIRSASALPKVARLPGTAAEARAITPALEKYAKSKAQSYLEQDALEEVFKKLQSPRVLVLSTHGYFLPRQEPKPADPADAEAANQHRSLVAKEGGALENPLLRCGLLLAGCNQRDQANGQNLSDGVLTGLEIVGADLRGTELVVLSACETGLGEVNDGEGVAGLRQAFQLAGARAVASTLWQIHDEASVALMTEYFANLAAGQSNAEALRTAQVSIIKARREREGAAHPFFWAAYTVTGK